MTYKAWDVFGAAGACGIGFETRYSRAVALRTGTGGRIVKVGGFGRGGLEQWMMIAMLENGLFGRCLAWKLVELATGVVPLVLPLGALRFWVQFALRLAVYLVMTWLSGLALPARQRWHGAEHQVLNCLRADKPLNEKNASEQSMLLDTCGTVCGFWAALAGLLAACLIHTPWAMVDALAAILASSVLQRLIERGWNRLVPLDRTGRGGAARMLVCVGVLYQRLCVATPDRAELEDAIAAIRAVQDRDAAKRRRKR